MIVDFINGKNASIFAFGQTGSGKTHTMVCYPRMLLELLHGP